MGMRANAQSGVSIIFEPALYPRIEARGKNGELSTRREARNHLLSAESNTKSNKKNRKHSLRANWTNVYGSRAM